MNDDTDKDTGSGNSDETPIPDIVKDVLDTPILPGGTHIKIKVKT